MTPPADHLVQSVPAWLDAAHDPAISSLLESIYSDLSSEITTRGPSCWASGRCCNFEQAGHRLYVTGLEAAYTVSRLDSSHPPLNDTTLSDAQSRGGCPFQSRNLCGIHTIKPLACRIYFCDRSAQSWQSELAEHLHNRVKQVHSTHNIPYHYAEWRSLLAAFLAQSELRP